MMLLQKKMRKALMDQDYGLLRFSLHVVAEKIYT